MISHFALALPLLALPASQGPLPVDLGGGAREDRFETLEAEYKRAALDWRRAQRAAKKADEPFDREHPVHAYFPRFETLAAAGSGRAVQWVGLQAEDTHHTPGEVKALKRAAFERLSSEFVTEEYLLDFVKAASKQERWLSDEELCRMLGAIHERNESDEARALAGYDLAVRLAAHSNDADTARAGELLDRIAADLPKTKGGKKAKQKLAARRFEVGKVAPDFEAEDVDGNAIRLSDYRGKVLVLDFWGFW